MRIIFCRGWIPQGAGDQPGYCINDRQGRQFSPRKHKISELALAQISGYWPEARELFKNKLDKFSELREKLSTPSFIRNYIEIINNNMDIIFTGWWSEILTLEEYNKYENPIK